MKTLTCLAKEIHDNMSNPHKLAKIYLYCSAEFAYYSDEIKNIKIKKNEEWIRIKESGDNKDISDKKTDMLYGMTIEGKKEIEYSYLLKGLEKMMSAIKQSAYLNNIEIKNQA
jgi:hypothetical protein